MSRISVGADESSSAFNTGLTTANARHTVITEHQPDSCAIIGSLPGCSRLFPERRMTAIPIPVQPLNLQDGLPLVKALTGIPSILLRDAPSEQ
jgi:hypothetical protein